MYCIVLKYFYIFVVQNNQTFRKSEQKIKCKDWYDSIFH